MIEDGDLAGELFQVPDRWWGFEANGRENHPGACVGYDQRGFRVTLLKGTDPRSARYRETHVIVDPDQSNQLLKRTAFAIKPVIESARKVSQLRGKRLIGTLAKLHLNEMRQELIRLFGDGNKHG